jgi:hypothetical protein
MGAAGGAHPPLVGDAGGGRLASAGAAQSPRPASGAGGISGDEAADGR